MGLNSSAYVFNSSDKVILARVAQEETYITELEVAGEVQAAEIGVSAEVRTKLERRLDTTGFATIAPRGLLDFDLPRRHGKAIYVTIATADGLTPICYDYPAPHHKAVVVTAQLTIETAAKNPAKSRKNRFLYLTIGDDQGRSRGDLGRRSLLSGDSHEKNSLESDDAGEGMSDDEEMEDDECWETEDGDIYWSSMVRKIHKQSEVDEEARMLAAADGKELGLVE